MLSSAQTFIATAMLNVVQWIDPRTAPLVGLIQKIAPLVEANAPLIRAAIAEGPTAFAAAEKAAPELAQAIRDVADHAVAANPGADHAAVKETVARRALAHLAPPATQDDWSAAVRGFPKE